MADANRDVLFTTRGQADPSVAATFGALRDQARAARQEVESLSQSIRSLPRIDLGSVIGGMPSGWMSRAGGNSPNAPIAGAGPLGYANFANGSTNATGANPPEQTYRMAAQAARTTADAAVQAARANNALAASHVQVAAAIQQQADAANQLNRAAGNPRGWRSGTAAWAAPDGANAPNTPPTLRDMIARQLREHRRAMQSIEADPIAAERTLARDQNRFMRRSMLMEPEDAARAEHELGIRRRMVIEAKKRHDKTQAENERRRRHTEQFADRFGAAGERAEAREERAKEAAIREAGRLLNRQVQNHYRQQNEAHQSNAASRQQRNSRDQGLHETSSALLGTARGVAQMWIAGNAEVEGMIRRLIELRGVMDTLRFTEIFRGLDHAGLFTRGSTMARMLPGFSRMGRQARVLAGRTLPNMLAPLVGASAAGYTGTAGMMALGGSTLAAGTAMGGLGYLGYLGATHHGHDPFGHFERAMGGIAGGMMNALDYMPGTYETAGRVLGGVTTGLGALGGFMIGGAAGAFGGAATGLSGALSYGDYVHAAATRARTKRLEDRQTSVNKRLGEYFSGSEWADAESMRSARFSWTGSAVSQQMESAALRAPWVGESAQYDYDPILRQRMEIRRQRYNEGMSIRARGSVALAALSDAEKQYELANSAFKTASAQEGWGEEFRTTRAQRAAYDPDARVRGDFTPEKDYVTKGDDQQREQFEFDRMKNIETADADRQRALENVIRAKERINDLSKEEYDSLLKSVEAEQRLAVETQRRGRSLTRTLATDPRAMSLYQTYLNAKKSGTVLDPFMLRQISGVTGGMIADVEKDLDAASSKRLGDMGVELPEEYKNNIAPEKFQDEANRIRAERAHAIDRQTDEIRDAASRLDPALHELTNEIKNLIRAIQQTGPSRREMLPQGSVPNYLPTTRQSAQGFDQIAVQQYNAQRQAAIG